MTIQLNLERLADLPQSVTPPQYDFVNRQASIAHIGIGAFHKAHQATFTEDMMAKSDGHHRIIAISLRSAGARNLLAQQDYLYTAVEKSDQGQAARVIGAIQKVLVAPESPANVISVLADPAIKVITSTITEKGYCLLPGNTGLDLKHEDIQHDLHNLNAPKSMIGFVVKACQIRQQNKAQGFTFISCDNLPDNSHVAGKAIMDFATQIDRNLVDWIQSNVAFCNSMVDRIVPAVTEDDLDSFEDKYGYRDPALVSSEPFRQWVIEDNFFGERPPWDISGALFVKDVALYEKMKLRYLNGSHSALAYLGKITDHKYIHQAIGQPVLRTLVDNLMADMKQSLAGTMDFDFDAYGKVIVDRFLNDEIQYQTQQVATDGSQKLPQRIFAPLTELLNGGTLSDPMCLVIAGWIMYLRGQSETGQQHDISDPLRDKLIAIWQQSDTSPKALISGLTAIEGLLPTQLINDSKTLNTIAHYVEQYERNGVLKTIESALS